MTDRSETSTNARLEAMIEVLGRERFDRSAATAQEGVQSHGDRMRQQELYDVASDLLDSVWQSEMTEAERIATSVALYRRMPCTAIMHELAVHHYPGMSVEGRRLMWKLLRVDLGDEDARRADPILVYLAQEYFDSPDPLDVEQEWRWLVDDQPHDLALRRVLGVSFAGPQRIDLIDQLKPEDADTLRRLRDDYLTAPDAWIRSR
jgi:hypothetical protein